MKTEPINHQPILADRPAPDLINLLNAPNPTDTALVGPVSSPGALLPMSVQLPQPSQKPRNGKIARLPKPARDVVNRMLFLHVPQEQIVAALDELGIRVNQQNISNWKTRGGYREWCLAQEHAVQLRLHQDNLLDLLRRHDASELPEVGLQAAATQLSQFFLTLDARQLLASDPKEYERRVSMLACISAQVKALQKYRDDCAKALGHDHNPDRIRSETEASLQNVTNSFTATIPESSADPTIPHRNLLPSPTELLHVSDRPPSSEPSADSVIEMLEWLRKRSSTAKPQLAAGAAANENTPPKV
jgi:hypothetical protein